MPFSRFSFPTICTFFPMIQNNDLEKNAFKARIGRFNLKSANKIPTGMRMITMKCVTIYIDSVKNKILGIRIKIFKRVSKSYIRKHWAKFMPNDKSRGMEEGCLTILNDNVYFFDKMKTFLWRDRGPSQFIMHLNDVPHTTDECELFRSDEFG